MATPCRAVVWGPGTWVLFTLVLVVYATATADSEMVGYFDYSLRHTPANTILIRFTFDLYQN